MSPISEARLWGIGIGAGLFLASWAELTAAEGTLRDVMVVMSDDTGPYQETLEGIKEALGPRLRWVVAGKEGPPEIPPDVAAVVTLGARTSLMGYPARVKVIHALAPAFPMESRRGILVAMEPTPATLIAKIRGFHPALRRLGVVYVSKEAGSYASALALAAVEQGMAVEAHVAEGGAESLPDVLRDMSGRVDALWIPPDPRFINGTNLSICVEFARANRIALYVPTAGLVAKGATAAFAPSLREIGRLSAQAAVKRGEALEIREDLYAQTAETTVSRKGAAAVGLELGESQLRMAEKVVP